MVKPETYFYVMRTHSMTDRQMLWKVMSRRIADRQTAEQWMDHCKRSEKNSKHEFFIVESAYTP